MIRFGHKGNRIKFMSLRVLTQSFCVLRIMLLPHRKWKDLNLLCVGLCDDFVALSRFLPKITKNTRWKLVDLINAMGALFAPDSYWWNHRLMIVNELF